MLCDLWGSAGWTLAEASGLPASAGSAVVVGSCEAMNGGPVGVYGSQFGLRVLAAGEMSVHLV